MEIWKEIPRYLFCEASNNGKIRYKKDYKIHGLALRERPLKLGGFGYYQVTIHNKTESVHNLVAEAFLGCKPFEGAKVDHINNNKLDNRPENLRYITHSANTYRTANTGQRILFYEGEVWLIKRLYAKNVPVTMIAKMFKASIRSIYNILNNSKINHTKENFIGAL